MTIHAHLGRRSLALLGASGILTLATALPAMAGQAPGVVLPDPIGNGIRGPGLPPAAPFVPEGSTVELIQIGLGTLGGIALAGAGAAMMRSRGSHHVQPA